MEELSLGQRLHIDFPLLIGILVLCAIGLVVIYSAGGQDIDLVYRQAVKLMIALVGMVIVAQLSPAGRRGNSSWTWSCSVCIRVAFVNRFPAVLGICPVPPGRLFLDETGSHERFLG